MSERSTTVHPVVIRPFIEAIRRLGIALPDWAQDGAQAAARTRVPHAQAVELLAWCVAYTGRDDLGVLAAEAVEPGDFDLVELAARTQSTVGEGLATVAALAGILDDGVTWKVARSELTTRLTIQLPTFKPPHPAAYDFTVASLVIAARRQTQVPDLQPSCVWLPCPQPPGEVPLRRVLSTSRLIFDADELAVEVLNSVLELPLTRADPSTGHALREAARELIPSAAADERESQLANKVRQLVREGLSSGAFDVDLIARKLHMSQRTLRRKLDGEGVGFRELIEQERRELALAQLKDPTLSTDDVAAQLGFTTAQAFHRAFKSWTGDTVQAYRARSRVAPRRP